MGYWLLPYLKLTNTESFDTTNSATTNEDLMFPSSHGSCGPSCGSLGLLWCWGCNNIYCNWGFSLLMLPSIRWEPNHHNFRLMPFCLWIKNFPFMINYKDTLFYYPGICFLICFYYISWAKIYEFGHFFAEILPYHMKFYLFSTIWDIFHHIF